MAEGIDRTILLPELPRIERPLGANGGRDIEARLRALERNIGELSNYLEQEQVVLSQTYDELARRLNEFLFERIWADATPAQITANQNDYVLGDAIVHRISSDAARTITGFQAPVAPRMVPLVNVGGFNITVSHQNVGSAAANRVIQVAGVDFALAPDDSTIVWYDTTTTRWRQIIG